MMFYVETKKPWLILIPTISVSLEDEFWIEIDWLNFIFGWRSGNAA